MKKIILFLMILIINISMIFALDMYSSIGFEYSYDTNVFSDPLPLYDPYESWLNWKNQHPFIKKHHLGINTDFSLFKEKTSRTGISASISVKIPIASTSIRPEPTIDGGTFSGPWDYKEYESLGEQRTAVFGAIGPIFKANLGKVDVGIALRLSLGGYTYKDSEVILGVQAEYFSNIYVSENLYLNFKLNCDSHLMRFINNDEYIFEPHYQMLSASPSIGVGINF